LITVSAKTVRVAGCMAIAVLLATAIHAAEADDERSDDEPQPSGITERVEVHAPHPVGEDVAAFATRIDTDEVTMRGEDLAEVLGRVPGARVFDYGGLGSYATLSLRASGTDQVTVLVDGVPQNRALGGAVDLSSIPATQVESVTVFRGFAPASYGLGGIGGLVEVRTRAPSEKAVAQVDLLVGDLETRRLSAGAVLKNGAGNLRIGAEGLRSNGDFVYLSGAATPFNSEDDGLERRTNNDIEQLSFLARQTFDRVGPGRMGASLRVQRRDRGVPGLGDFKSKTARLDDSLGDLTLSWSRRGDGSIEGIDLLANGFRHESRLDDSEGDLILSPLIRTTLIRGGAASGLVRFGVGRHRILTRAELRHENASVQEAVSGSDGGGKRTVFALTAEEMVTLGRLTIAPSLRWESLQNEFRGTIGYGLPPEDLSNNALTGKIGLSWVLDPGLVLRGSVGSFHRNPNLIELFGDTGAVQGNPNLRPERGESAELGIQWSRKKSRVDWNLELVGFARRVDDMIALRQLTQAVSKAYNVLQAEVRGVEGSLTLNVPRGWSFQASGTLQHAEDSSGGFTDGQPLPFQPDALGRLGVGYTNEGFLARWELHYVGENSTTPTDFPEFRIPGRIVHDLLLSHRWRSGIRAGVDLRNLFDRQILDLDRYPLPGRTIFVHVGWRPGGPA